jgi:hypothetical protein
MPQTDAIDWLEAYFKCTIKDVPGRAEGADAADLMALYQEQVSHSSLLHPGMDKIVHVIGTQLVGNFRVSPFLEVEDRRLGVPLSHRSLPDVVTRLLLTGDHVFVDDPILHVADTHGGSGRLGAAIFTLVAAAPLIRSGALVLTDPPQGDEIPEHMREALEWWVSFGEFNQNDVSFETSFWDWDPRGSFGINVRSRALEQIRMACLTGTSPVWTLPSPLEQRAMRDLLIILAVLGGTEDTVSSRDRDSTTLLTLPIPDPAGLPADVLDAVRHSSSWERFRSNISFGIHQLTESLEGRDLTDDSPELIDFRRTLAATMVSPSLSIGPAWLKNAMTSGFTYSVGVLSGSGNWQAALTSVAAGGAGILIDQVSARRSAKWQQRLFASLGV